MGRKNLEYTERVITGVMEDLAVRSAEKVTGLEKIIDVLRFPHKIREIWQNRQLINFFEKQTVEDGFDERQFIDHSIARATAKVLMGLPEDTIRKIYNDEQAEWILKQRKKANEDDGIISHLERFDIATGREKVAPFFGIFGMNRRGRIANPFRKEAKEDGKRVPLLISPTNILLQHQEDKVKGDDKETTIGELIRAEAVTKASNFLETLKKIDSKKEKGLDNTNARIALNAIFGGAINLGLLESAIPAIFAEFGVKLGVPTLIGIMGIAIPNLPWLLAASTIIGVGAMGINLVKNITERRKNIVAKALYAKRSKDYTSVKDKVSNLVENRLLTISVELQKNTPTVIKTRLAEAKQIVSSFLGRVFFKKKK